MSTSFIDYVRIHVSSGDGGDGCISFAREKGKPFGGPNGGDGGRGGSIWFVAEPEMVTLLDLKLRPMFRAQRGQHGMGHQRSGRSAEDIEVRVPLGTVISDADTGEEIGDIARPGQRLLVAKGGDGGLGNQHYATSTNKAPRKALPGWPGQQRNLILELKVIADAGLVGLPNAGKSTLLKAMTDANPRIAPYPFTTLHPNLGVFLSADTRHRITLADIPGLIEGAHSGAGLGGRFLRHVERTLMLVHLVSPQAGEDSSGALTEADPDPEALLYAYDLVENELKAYSQRLLEKQRLVCLDKIDLLAPEQVTAIREAFAKRGIELMCISGETGEGVSELRRRIEAVVVAHREAPGDSPQQGEESKREVIP